MAVAGLTPMPSLMPLVRRASDWPLAAIYRLVAGGGYGALVPGLLMGGASSVPRDSTFWVRGGVK